jgi:hypothetical protein
MDTNDVSIVLINVYCPKGLDVYDDDVVTAYGTVFGNFSYKSQAGWDITIPAVLAQVVT